MAASRRVRARLRLKSRRPGRWAPAAAFVALVLCGCGTTQLPVINGFPGSPGAPGSAVPVPGQGGAPTPGRSAAVVLSAAARHPGTYAALARRALATLEGEYYNGAGQWNLCVPLRCSAGNRDWGADSLTYVLYLHWLLTGDPAVAPIMNALTATSPSAHSGGSDVPLWDSIAAAREYQVTHSPGGAAQGGGVLRLRGRLHGQLSRSAPAPESCTSSSGGGSTQLKTLETDVQLHQGRRCCSTRSPTSAAT